MGVVYTIKFSAQARVTPALPPASSVLVTPDHIDANSFSILLTSTPLTDDKETSLLCVSNGIKLQCAIKESDHPQITQISQIQPKEKETSNEINETCVCVPICETDNFLFFCRDL